MTSAARFLRRLWRTDAPLTAVGLAMVGVLVATLVGLVIDPQTITGAPAWLKPAKFAASIAIYALSLAWVFTYLPAWRKTRRFASWVTAVVLTLEIVIISLQAWRGTESHFNVRTLLDSALFGVMGLAIAVQTLSSIAVAAALWRQHFEHPALGMALRLGFTLTIAGALVGGMMTRPTDAQLADARTSRMTLAGAHTVGAPDGGPGIAGTGWSREHGDLRVPHFVGLHALQALVGAALLLSLTRRSEGDRVRLVVVAGGSYVALFVILLVQALHGGSVVAPTVTTTSVLAMWATLTVVAGWLVTGRTETARTHAVLY